MLRPASQLSRLSTDSYSTPQDNILQLHAGA